MNANRYMRDSLRTADRSNMDRLKLECALGLCGEAGEVAEQVKKHFLKLRCSPAAHPQMREVALILLDKVHALIPVCFDDIWSEYHADV